MLKKDKNKKNKNNRKKKNIKLILKITLNQKNLKDINKSLGKYHLKENNNSKIQKTKKKKDNNKI